jgi:murein DD-endopeptidase MepM/ murein hydrolase activator NlpD
MKLISPVGSFYITSGYGPRNIGGGASRNHRGLDIKAKSGTICRAPKSGLVKVAAYKNNSCGGTIIIEHGPTTAIGGSMTTSYCHMRDIFVKEGQYVFKGEEIGETGGGSRDRGKGNSLGPHLHFGVKKDGRFIDPEPFFRAGILRKSIAIQASQIALISLGAGVIIYITLKLTSR